MEEARQARFASLLACHHLPFLFQLMWQYLGFLIIPHPLPSLAECLLTVAWPCLTLCSFVVRSLMLCSEQLLTSMCTHCRQPYVAVAPFSSAINLRRCCSRATRALIAHTTASCEDESFAGYASLLTCESASSSWADCISSMSS
jgi:hypothetical protein